MDDLDRRLIGLLSEDARLPSATLARRLAVSRGTVQNRVERLGASGVLLGFTDPRTFDSLPPEERRERALAGFADLFGTEALEPIDYIDHCWGTEEFAPGGPTAAVPPGSWTTYGPWLRKPVEGIHWAGTETSDEWTGFLDGAVRSGRRVATEVHRELSTS